MKGYKIILLVMSALMAASMAAGCVSFKNEDDLSLTVGLMPAVDAAPVLLAEKNGYFTGIGANG